MPAPPTAPGYAGVSPAQDRPDYEPQIGLWTQVAPASGEAKQSTVAWIAGSNAPISINRIIAGTNPADTLYYQQLLEANGFLGGSYSKGNWDPASREALRMAMWAANRDKTPLDEYLGTGAFYDKQFGPNGQPAPYTGPTTTTQTSESTNLSSRPTARAVLAGALATEMGREPSRAEVDAFLTGLNMAEKKNPTITTTTTTSDPNPKDHTVAVTSSSTTEQSDVDPAAKARNYAKDLDPQEAKRYQEGNYYGLIAQMLGV